MPVHPQVFCLQHYKGLFKLKRECFNLMGEEGWKKTFKLDKPVRGPCFFLSLTDCDILDCLERTIVVFGTQNKLAVFQG